MRSSTEQPSEEAPPDSVALKPVGQLWTRRDTALVAGLWALVAVALALLSIAAHFNAMLPGDEGIATLIQKMQFPPLVHFINFSSDANWPAPAAYAALAIILVLLVSRQLSAAIAAVIASLAPTLRMPV